jgi:hypothetical protein
MTFMRKSSSPNGWMIKTSLYGCSYTYPIGHWGPTKELALGQWYRFEYFVHYVDASHIQVHPRVYDDKNNLMYSDAEYMQSDPGMASWNGRADWSLASYYAGGNSFCVGDASVINDIGLGNNGQAGSEDNGKYWYFGGVQVRTDTWAGPIPDKSGAADTTGVDGSGASLPSGDVEGVRQQPEQPRVPQQVPNETPRSPRGGKAIPRTESVPEAGDSLGPVVAGQNLPNGDVAKPALSQQSKVSPRTVDPRPVRDAAFPPADAVGKSPR